MKNTTQAPVGQGCVVLTHPRFDRPKVENPKHPGPKRGCLSFTRAAYKRRALRAAVKRLPEAVPSFDLNDCIHRLADYVQIVFKVDTSAAYRIAGTAGGEFMRQKAGGVA
ncbi:MAG: hypothetical protein ACN6PJ_27435 [Achromobacter sp.]|uniref:hypothetical protein n=1 Tax=Achromobacter sp. TaxID=134375 RepID=UPI003CFFC20B